MYLLRRLTVSGYVEVPTVCMHELVLSGPSLMLHWVVFCPPMNVAHCRGTRPARMASKESGIVDDRLSIHEMTIATLLIRA